MRELKDLKWHTEMCRGSTEEEMVVRVKRGDQMKTSHHEITQPVWGVVSEPLRGGCGQSKIVDFKISLVGLF